MVRVGGGVARVHYTGYDATWLWMFGNRGAKAQFDEEVPLDLTRLRPFGQLRSEKLAERKGRLDGQGLMGRGCYEQVIAT